MAGAHRNTSISSSVQQPSLRSGCVKLDADDRGEPETSRDREADEADAGHRDATLRLDRVRPPPQREAGVDQRMRPTAASASVLDNSLNRPDLSLNQTGRLRICGRCRSMFDVPFTAHVFVRLPYIVWVVIGDYFQWWSKHAGPLCRFVGDCSAGC